MCYHLLVCLFGFFFWIKKLFYLKWHREYSTHHTVFGDLAWYVCFTNDNIILQKMIARKNYFMTYYIVISNEIEDNHCIKYFVAFRRIGCKS